MTDDLDAIRAAHRIAKDGETRCGVDMQPWPCDTARVFARLHEVEAERDEWKATYFTVTDIAVGEVNTLRAAAITPEQRAVVEAGVKLHRCWSLRNMQDFDVAVDALLAARKP